MRNQGSLFFQILSLLALTLALIAETSLNPARAAEQPSIRSVYFHGNGCRDPQDRPTASATLSPDNSTLSVIFDRFMVEAGVGTPLSRPSEGRFCNVQLSLNVPKGLQVGFVSTDYRGFLDLPGQATSQLKVTTMYVIGMGAKKISSVEQTYTGPQTDMLELNTQSPEIQWGTCGVGGMLVISSNLSVTTNRAREHASAMLDSIDSQIRGGLNYHLVWKSCQ